MRIKFKYSKTSHKVFHGNLIGIENGRLKIVCDDILSRYGDHDVEILDTTKAKIISSLTNKVFN